MFPFPSKTYSLTHAGCSCAISLEPWHRMSGYTDGTYRAQSPPHFGINFTHSSFKQSTSLTYVNKITSLDIFSTNMHLDSNETVCFPKVEQRPYIFRPFNKLRGCPVPNRHECIFGGCMCMYTGEYTLFFGWPHSVHSFNI